MSIIRIIIIYHDIKTLNVFVLKKTLMYFFLWVRFDSIPIIQSQKILSIKLIDPTLLSILWIFFFNKKDHVFQYLSNSLKDNKKKKDTWHVKGKTVIHKKHNLGRPLLEFEALEGPKQEESKTSLFLTHKNLSFSL